MKAEFIIESCGTVATFEPGEVTMRLQFKQVVPYGSRCAPRIPATMELNLGATARSYAYANAALQSRTVFVLTIEPQDGMGLGVETFDAAAKELRGGE